MGSPKPRLTKRERKILEQFGLIEEPLVPSVEKLSEFITRWGGRFRLSTADGGVAEAVVTIDGQEFENVADVGNQALCGAFCGALVVVAAQRGQQTSFLPDEDDDGDEDDEEEDPGAGLTAAQARLQKRIDENFVPYGQGKGDFTLVPKADPLANLARAAIAEARRAAEAGESTFAFHDGVTTTLSCDGDSVTIGPDGTLLDAEPEGPAVVVDIALARPREAVEEAEEPPLGAPPAFDPDLAWLTEAERKELAIQERTLVGFPETPAEMVATLRKLDQRMHSPALSEAHARVLKMQHLARTRALKAMAPPPPPWVAYALDQDGFPVRYDPESDTFSTPEGDAYADRVIEDAYRDLVNERARA